MKNNRKGFTLAELLIVVTIIAVLVAIAIPIFTAQLEKSREATDKANLRAAYAEVMTGILTWDGKPGTVPSVNVNAKQTQANWQGDGDVASVSIADGISGYGFAATAKTAGNSWTVKASASGTELVIAIE